MEIEFENNKIRRVFSYAWYTQRMLEPKEELLESLKLATEYIEELHDLIDLWASHGKIPKLEKDMINPDHYKQYPIEVIDMMLKVFGKEYVAQYCLITAFKYRMRLGYKDDVEQELKKEKWYLDKYNSIMSSVNTIDSLKK